MHIQYMRRIEIVSVIVLNIDSTFELNIVDVYVRTFHDIQSMYFHLKNDYTKIHLAEYEMSTLINMLKDKRT